MELMSMTSRASIWSVMRMTPISAAMEEPARPSMMAVSTGPSSRMRVRDTAEPSATEPANRTRV